MCNSEQLASAPSFTVECMDGDSAKAADAVTCPICSRLLKRTSDRLLSAFECEQCGPFSDFNAGGSRGRGPDRSPGDPGSEPVG